MAFYQQKRTAPQQALFRNGGLRQVVAEEMKTIKSQGPMQAEA
jgi:hypothetical protein